MKFTLHEMCVTGMFGALPLYVRRYEVLSTLGEPHDWSVSRGRRERDFASLWKYGSLQIAFKKTGRVVYFCLDFNETPTFSPDIEPIGYFPTKAEPIEQFKHFLTQHEIVFGVDAKYPFDEDLCLIINCPSGHIRAYFAERQRLIQIYLGVD